jgi:hypothetical protein
MTDHILICTTDRIMAVSVITGDAVSNHVGFASWAFHAHFTKSLLIRVAKGGTTVVITAESILPWPIGLTSWTSRACVIHYLFVGTTKNGVAIGVAARSVVSRRARLASWAVHALVTRDHLV